MMIIFEVMIIIITNSNSNATNHNVISNINDSNKC